MASASPNVITLDAADRQFLAATARSGTAEHRRVVRARIVLAAADGQSNAGIARELRLVEDTVRKWRKRFCDEGMPGLKDRPRSGRPRVFPATVVAEVKALACELPTQTEVALARWSCPELAQDAIKPWQHRSWIFPRDPYFATKAARVLNLYARVWEGEPLGENDFVLSSDEKPGVQARYRKHDTLPAGTGRPMRVESEYTRGGTLAYFAAYDVHRAHVIGRCEPSTGITPFASPAEQVMTTEPYASARRVFWIVDKGASHRGWTAAARLNDAWPTAHMVHLPVHASWLNQVVQHEVA